MPRCGLCEHFDQTRRGSVYHTCKLENPRKVHDPAADACETYQAKGPQQSLLIDVDFRKRGALRTL